MLDRKIKMCLNPAAEKDNNDSVVAAYETATEIAAKLTMETAKNFKTMLSSNINMQTSNKQDCHCMDEPSESGAVKLLRITVKENGERKIRKLVTTENIAEFADTDFRPYFLPEIKPEN